MKKETLYKSTLHFMALMLSVYGTPIEGSNERDYNDDPDQCLNYLLNGKWKTSEKGSTGEIRKNGRQMTFYDLF